MSSHLPPLEAPLGSGFQGGVDSTGVAPFHGPVTALDRNYSRTRAVLTEWVYAFADSYSSYIESRLHTDRIVKGSLVG